VIVTGMPKRPAVAAPLRLGVSAVKLCFDSDP